MEPTSVRSVKQGTSALQQALRLHARPTQSTVLEVPKPASLARPASAALTRTRTLFLAHLAISRQQEPAHAQSARLDPTASLPSPPMVMPSSAAQEPTLLLERPDAESAQQAANALEMEALTLP